jgi:hypothetical protein
VEGAREAVTAREMEASHDYDRQRGMDSWAMGSDIWPATPNPCDKLEARTRMCGRWESD